MSEHKVFQHADTYYQGKVRDVYTFNDKLVSITSDRISAFDHILPKEIPFKGQVLNQMAAHFLNLTKELVPNWLEAMPAANVSLGKKCTPFKVEMVIRGYLAGHAWRTYKSGLRELCGVALQEGLKENDKLPHPIITPATKADEGHDEDISKQEIIQRGIVSKEDYEVLEKYTHTLFEFGTAYAGQKDLILVDTKFEFGKTTEGQIVLIDELLTPDSSRYFYKEGYKQRQKVGEPQKQLSKEFVRQWLIEQGFQGLEGQQMPEISDQKASEISKRYIELYEQITGQNFKPQNISLDQLKQEVFKSLK